MASAHHFTSIPQLDLSLAETAEGKPKLLQQLRHALTEVGFLYVRNHGVPESVINGITHVALPILPALSAESKAEIALERSPHFLGYSSTGSETTAGKADHREQIEFATELRNRWTPERPLYERLAGPNQWPSLHPKLRPIIESYIYHLTQLGERFLLLVAEALCLPAQTFLPFLSRQHRLKLVHYPALPVSPPSSPSSPSPLLRTQGVGPHKDSSGWWTFLLQASPPPIGGLQALNKHGQWVDVPPIPGTFVVNIGQAFEVVTHGICKATTHQVVLSDPHVERYSVPFFQGVTGTLTKEEALGALRDHFTTDLEGWLGGTVSGSSVTSIDRDKYGGEFGGERKIDSAFLDGKCDTWGESQLRTKIRSHKEVGKRFYADFYEAYTRD